MSFVQTRIYRTELARDKAGTDFNRIRIRTHCQRCALDREQAHSYKKSHTFRFSDHGFQIFTSLAAVSGDFFLSFTFTLGYQFAGQRDEFFAVVDGVVQRVEAANQESGDPQVVVVEQRFGHLLRGADQ